jgi:hypothetical protein
MTALCDRIDDAISLDENEGNPIWSMPPIQARARNLKSVAHMGLFSIAIEVPVVLLIIRMFEPGDSYWDSFRQAVCVFPFVALGALVAALSMIMGERIGTLGFWLSAAGLILAVLVFAASTFAVR